MTEDYQGLTPPPERLKQWEDDILNERDNVDHVLDCAWKDGFRAGADQELEACVEWLTSNNNPNNNPRWAPALQEARRPKPPSLAEQALQALERMDQPRWMRSDEDQSTIRTALERLQELENNG